MSDNEMYWRVDELAAELGQVGEAMADAIRRKVSDQELPLSALDGARITYGGDLCFKVVLPPVVRKIPVTISFAPCNKVPPGL